MSEIKFACPHCSQHVACDRDYADMCVVCPSCGKPMEVPRLSAADQPQKADAILVLGGSFTRPLTPYTELPTFYPSSLTSTGATLGGTFLTVPPVAITVPATAE